MRRGEWFAASQSDGMRGSINQAKRYERTGYRNFHRDGAVSDFLRDIREFADPGRAMKGFDDE